MAWIPIFTNAPKEYDHPTHTSEVGHITGCRIVACRFVMTQMEDYRHHGYWATTSHNEAAVYRVENPIKIQLEGGMVVQIDPMHDEKFGGCLMIVTEPKPWGAQGYVQVPSADGVLQAWYRCEHEHMAVIGHAKWEIER